MRCFHEVRSADCYFRFVSCSHQTTGRHGCLHLHPLISSHLFSFSTHTLTSLLIAFKFKCLEKCPALLMVLLLVSECSYLLLSDRREAEQKEHDDPGGSGEGRETGKGRDRNRFAAAIHAAQRSSLCCPRSLPYLLILSPTSLIRVTDTHCAWSPYSQLCMNCASKLSMRAADELQSDALITFPGFCC